jgi:hypothetical protein
MHRSLLATAALLACTGASHAALALDGPLSWISDIRRCSASYNGNGSGSSWQDRTVAYDPYQGGADILVTNGLETWSAHCSQESQMDSYGMSFVASSEATVLASPTSSPLSAQSQSKFDMWFTIDAPIDYHMQGRVSEEHHADSMATVRLTDLNGNIIERVTSSPGISRSFDLTGRLQPGTYRLYAESLGKCRTIGLIVAAEGQARCSLEFSAAAVEEDPQQPPPAPRPHRMASTDAPPARP